MISYDHLTRHIVPGPRSLVYFVPLILLPISLLIPRTILTRWQNIAIFMPAITVCSLKAMYDMNGVDVISVNALLWSLFLIALQDPWQTFRLIKSRGDPDGHIHSKRGNSTGVSSSTSISSEASPSVHPLEQSYPGTLRQRVPWVGKLLVSIRLDNWKIGKPSHDRIQPPPAGFASRKEFLAHALLCFVRGFIVLDATRTYISSDPYFTHLDVSISSALPFAAPSLLSPRVFRSMLVGAQAWALIGQMFYLPAAFPVILNALGLIADNVSPHNWPPYFGSPEAIFKFGVRGFWGTFWHQTMRWSTSGLGYAISDSMRLPHSSLLRYSMISASAFGLSGIVHAGLVPPEPLTASIAVNDVRWNMAMFFWLQALAVSIEALTARIAIALGGGEYWKRGRGNMIRMTINGVWTVAWFSFCIPFLADAARQLGYWRVWPLPLSLIRGLRGGGYITWS